MARERTCVACRQKGDDDSLIRLVVSPDGDVVVDLRGRLPGRGAWLHLTDECLSRVTKRPDSLRRPLRAPVSSDGLREQVIDVIGRAAMDGLSLASAAGALVGGHDALERELTCHRIAAVVVAEDASERTIASLKEAADPDVSFVVLPLGRDALGHKVGRGPRAALGVTSSRSASHLRQQLRRLRQLR